MTNAKVIKLDKKICDVLSRFGLKTTDYDHYETASTNFFFADNYFVSFMEDEFQGVEVVDEDDETRLDATTLALITKAIREEVSL